MNKTKIFLIFSLTYILLGVLCVIFNGASVHKNVSRYEPYLGCTPGQAVSTIDPYMGSCFDTQESRTGVYKTWVSWQFFSNNHGVDRALYIPFDMAVLTLANVAVIWLSFRAKKHPRQRKLASHKRS